MPLVALTLAAVLVACGGGGNNGQTKVQVNSVKVVGASLADSGTFGYKFTVQSASGTPYSVYTERVAGTYGAPALCPVYTSPDGGQTFSTHASCTNYAVAGAAVNYYAAPMSPFSQVQQLVDAGVAGFAAGDLLIVGEGAANDTATLVGAYLGGASGFSNLLLTLGVSATADPVASGQAYMQALADKLVAAIKTNAIDKGAQRIAVLNTLDVTQTPRFQAVLAQVSLAAGSNGPAAVAQVQALVNAWIQAYNAQLAAGLAPYAGKVVVVDFYSNFNDEIAHPAQYGLSNIKGTVCDEVVNHGVTSVATAGTTALSNAPTVPMACTDVAASATTPSVGDGTTNWWKSYLYADYFHPTPYGHQLLAQLVAKRLTEAGWL